MHAGGRDPACKLGRAAQWRKATAQLSASSAIATTSMARASAAMRARCCSMWRRHRVHATPDQRTELGSCLNSFIP